MSTIVQAVDAACTVPANRRLFFFRYKLLMLSLRLCLTCTCLFITGAFAYSHIRVETNTTSRLGLKYCSGLPCFRGLVVGKTTWREAVNALGGNSTTDGLPYYGKVTLLPSPDRRSLISILIEHPGEQAATIGGILMQYGAPSCVELYMRSNLLIFHYRMVEIVTSFVDDHIAPITPVSDIILLYSPEDSFLCKSIGQNIMDTSYMPLAVRSWQGFTSRQHYLMSR